MTNTTDTCTDYFADGGNRYSDSRFTNLTRLEAAMKYGTEAARGLIYRGTYLLTESMSEFHIDTDGVIYRMGMMDVTFRTFSDECLVAQWEPIVIGQQVRGWHIDPDDADRKRCMFWQTGTVTNIEVIA